MTNVRPWLRPYSHRRVDILRIRSFADASTGPTGTFIHPSLFLLQDCSEFIYSNRESFMLGGLFIRWRKVNLPRNEDLFWSSTSLRKMKNRSGRATKQSVPVMISAAVTSAANHLRLIEKTIDEQYRGKTPDTDLQPFRAILDAFQCSRTFSKVLKDATDNVAKKLSRAPEEDIEPEEELNLRADELDRAWQLDRAGKLPNRRYQESVAYLILQSKVDPLMRGVLDMRLPARQN